MKLLICPKCSDMFNLTKEVKKCGCGSTGGYYKDDGLNASYWGGIPVGFINSSLIKAIKNQPESGLGETFKAFVIPKVCPTMKRID